MKNKKRILGIGLLVVIIAAMAIIYTTFKEKPVEGSKSITIEVVDSKEETTTYELKTDAEYLIEAMEEAKDLGLTFSGEESEEFGMSIYEINGETADFNVDGAYWGFNVNGEYCNYGVSKQPVEDGDVFEIVYTVFE